MYRVSYSKFMALLRKADCTQAINQIKKIPNIPETIITIEIDFSIDDQGTEHEILTVLEFSIYTINKIIFGVPLKHESDFIIESRPRQPNPEYKLLRVGNAELPYTDPQIIENLDHLHEKALDLYEHWTETSDERSAGYEKCDQAYITIVQFIRRATQRINHARGRVGDLARVIEKMGVGEDLDIINERIDEIYEILKGDEK